MSQKFQVPSEKDLERNRLLGIFEGSAARLIFNLTSGAFLVGFLKYLGASDAMCGMILAIPVLATVVQFLSPIILESLPFRKTWILIGSTIHRLLLSSLILVPFLPVSPETRLWIIYAIFLVSYLAMYFINPAVSNMYVSFVPQNIRGRYFGRRESYILTTSTIVTLILGKILDDYTYGGHELNGHIVTYAVVFIFTLVNSAAYFFMKEVPLEHSREHLKIKEIFTIPFTNRKFINYFIMLILWNISSQIANAYFSVYLKSDLGLNYTTITVLSLINALVYIFSARKWGMFADKKGWSHTTMLTVGILSIAHTIWFFTSKGNPFILVLLSIAHIISGIAWSGINISFFNMQFDYTPDEKRTVYIGLSSAVSGITGYLAAIFGARLVGLYGSGKIQFLGRLLDIKQILFFTSAILLLLCSLYIRFFMKPKESSKE